MGRPKKPMAFIANRFITFNFTGHIISSSKTLLISVGEDWQDRFCL
jgi:hypothetical protein